MIDTPTSARPSDAPKTSPSNTFGKVAAVAAITVTMAAIGIGVAWMVHQGTTKHVSSRTVRGSVRLVVIDVSAGDVHLVNSVGPVRLRSTGRYLFSKPRMTTSTAGGILTVRSACGSWWLHDCSTNIQLSVPRGAVVDAKTDHGDITAEGLISRRIRADATGNVRLHLANDPNLIVARSERSDVTIRLPRAPYVVDARAALHQTHIDVPQEDSAPRTIEATANHGQIRIQSNRTRQSLSSDAHD
jgi:hypothetical protein